MKTVHPHLKILISTFFYQASPLKKSKSVRLPPHPLPSWATRLKSLENLTLPLKYGDLTTTHFPFSKTQSPCPPKIECYVNINHVEFSGSFPDYTIFICKFKTVECFCCNLHVFIFWDIWPTVENYFQKIFSPDEKIHFSPLFYSLPPLKLKKCKCPLLPRLKFFQAHPPVERGGCGGHYALFGKNGLILPNFGLIK